MKQITCNFKSNGENITVTGIVSDDLSELSKSKKNQATDIIDDYMEEDSIWLLFFEMSENLGYEIQFKVDKEDGTPRKTLKPVKAITWEGGADAIITDAQKVTVKTRQL